MHKSHKNPKPTNENRRNTRQKMHQPRPKKKHKQKKRVPLSPKQLQKKTAGKKKQARKTTAKKEKESCDADMFLNQAEHHYKVKEYALTKEYCELAIKSGDARAYILLAKIYQLGLTVNRDIAQAIELLKTAIALKNTDAMVALGLLYENMPDQIPNYLEAMCLYEKATNLGNAKAADLLGQMYREGLGCDIHYEKAKYLFEYSIGLGGVDAIRHLGYMYDLGQGVEKNTALANKQFEKAASLHDPRSLLILAKKLYDGTDIQADIYRTIAHLKQAKALNCVDAGYELGKIYYYGYRKFPPDFTKAKTEFEQAVTANHPGAIYQLARIYYYGDGVPQDIGRAISLFSDAAKLNYSKALYKMGILTAEGLGLHVKQNTELAVQYLQRAINKKCAEAMAYLGGMFYTGNNGIYQTDPRRAFELIKQSVELGCHSRLSLLMKMHQEGIGCTKNFDEENRLFKLYNDTILAKKLNHFEIKKPHTEKRVIVNIAAHNPIGRGSFAAVYKANIDAHPVVVKLCYKAGKGKRYHMQCNNEIAMLKKMADSDQVVKYIGDHFDDLFGYIVMERCHLSLSDLISSTDIALNELKNIITQLCLGIDVIHASDIIHRDLKLNNILITPNKKGGFTLKISDFGQGFIMNNDINFFDKQLQKSRNKINKKHLPYELFPDSILKQLQDPKHINPEFHRTQSAYACYTDKERESKYRHQLFSEVATKEKSDKLIDLKKQALIKIDIFSLGIMIMQLIQYAEFDKTHTHLQQDKLIVMLAPALELGDKRSIHAGDLLKTLSLSEHYSRPKNL